MFGVVALGQLVDLLLSGGVLQAPLVREVQLHRNGESQLLLLQLLRRDARLGDELLVTAPQVVHDVFRGVGDLRSDQHLCARTNVGCEFEGEELHVVGVQGDLETISGHEELGL